MRNRLSRSLALASLIALSGAELGSAQEAVLIKEIASREISVQIEPEADGPSQPIRQVASRELTVHIEPGGEEVFPQVASREISVIVVSDAAPSPISNLVVMVSPTGESVTVDWSSYDQLGQLDIARFDIYYTASGPFTNVDLERDRLTLRSVPAGQSTLTVDGLPAFTDHAFAVVPVDGLGHYNPQVQYAAGYVLAQQVSSREISVQIENGRAAPYAHVASREISVVVPDDRTPDPVTGVDSGFFVETSTTEFGAVVLDWTSYNEPAQVDVSSYEIYVGNAFFDHVTGHEPFATVNSGRQREMQSYLDLFSVDWEVYGTDQWQDFLGGDDYHDWGAQFSAAAGDESEDGTTISPAEQATLLAHEFNRPETATGIARAIARWNRSMTYYANGWDNPEDVPPGNDLDFIGLADLQAAGAAQQAVIASAVARGYGNPLDPLLTAMENAMTFLGQGDGVCARVRLKIEQEAVLTRDAFEASLEIINNDDPALEGIDISLRVTTPDGADATDLFGLRPPVVSGLSGGDVPGQSTANWSWTLIPSRDAAPIEETVYFVEGTLTYTYNGDLVTVPLAPQSITVLPNPSLFLKYFHQRDVYSDDPFTDHIEPSIPFTLGVMIENRGAGTARDLTITSAQPEIIENEKGLLVDFRIIATEVAGQNLSPSLTANFGDLLPGQIKIGRWLLISTLQGLFIDYQATFEHLDGHGDPRLSLIEGVEIHETIRQVRALGAKDDGLPDFLTNDLPDLLDFPDTIHLTDGTTAPVAVVDAGSLDTPAPGNLTVALSASEMGAGWSYLRIPNPAGTSFRVTRVTRSDGLVIPLDENVWTTDRAFLGFGLRPLREDLFHLLNCDSTGSYTVEYEAVAPPSLRRLPGMD